MSEEHKAAISKAQMGNKYGLDRVMSENNKEALRKSLIGNTWNKGKKRPKEVIDRIAAGNRGQKRTQEQRERISKAHLGVSNKGWKHTPDHRVQISINQGGDGDIDRIMAKDRVKADRPWLCERCGSKGDRINQHCNTGLAMHHIDFNRINNKINNLRLLCGKCHTKTHWEEGK